MARAVGIKDSRGERILCKLKIEQLQNHVIEQWLLEEPLFER